MYFSARNFYQKTIRGMIAEYQKAWRSYEKQRAYERGIVCSVPVKEITPLTDMVPAIISDDPG